MIVNHDINNSSIIKYVILSNKINKTQFELHILKRIIFKIIFLKKNLLGITKL